MVTGRTPRENQNARFHSCLSGEQKQRLSLHARKAPKRERAARVTRDDLGTLSHAADLERGEKQTQRSLADATSADEKIDLVKSWSGRSGRGRLDSTLTCFFWWFTCDDLHICGRSFSCAEKTRLVCAFWQWLHAKAWNTLGKILTSPHGEAATVYWSTQVVPPRKGWCTISDLLFKFLLWMERITNSHKLRNPALKQH